MFHDNTNQTIISSIEHDHDYCIVHLNNNNLTIDDDIAAAQSIDNNFLHLNNNYTIDDNITTTLAIDQSFGILQYENDEVN